MASKEDAFQSLSGRPETSEPSQAQMAPTNSTAVSNSATASSTRDSSPATVRHISSSSAVPTLRKQSSAVHLTPSSTNSPHTSRNTSPIRAARSGQDALPAPAGLLSRPTATALKSRQNSQDSSPHRPPALSATAGTVPSAAAIQRALSATSVPQLQGGPVTEAVSKLPKMQQRTAIGSGETTPTWPQSPRLRSPPPTAVRSRRNSNLSQRGTAAPSVVVQSATSTSMAPPPVPVAAEASKLLEVKKEDQLQTPLPKGSTRGPSGARLMLETVEENTSPNGTVASGPLPQNSTTTTTTPAATTHAKTQARTSDDDKPMSSVRNKLNGYMSDATSRLAESESEGNKSDGKGPKLNVDVQAAIRPKGVASMRATYPSLSSAKSRPSEGSRNMTVETETVSSVPQTTINTGDRNVTGRSDVGSIRMKPSTETIRPRKERKRASRKAPSLNNGTASSKADIFEARVASQVDEQNSSDSDETFVYESNTEPQDRRRHHSRTPSGTSLHSQSEFRHGIRNYGAVQANGDHRVAGKRSMKFSNNPYGLLDPPSEDRNGSARTHARHIGRLGLAGGSGSVSRTSLYGHDSPFTQASKLRNSDRQTSRPGSPKSITSQHKPSMLFGNSRKNDLDVEGGEGDDERTPLTGTVRTSRSVRMGRRYNADSIRSQSYYDGGFSRSQSISGSSSSRLSRFGGCVFGFVVFLLVVLGAVGFLVMSNKPLYGFEVTRIENVLASEQEIMLDLLVGAVNPNVLGVSVGEMDINVFAKSKHVSPINHDGYERLEVLDGPTARRNRAASGGHKDEGTDPIEGDSQTMLLGRILHFDSALTFDGSPMKRHIHYSMGELRLAKPGNKTETGGSERWERVLQYPFELILRGVLKYQLPVSSRMQSAAISATVLVHPEEGVNSKGYMRVEEVDWSERWQWVELDDLDDMDDLKMKEAEVEGM